MRLSYFYDLGILRINPLSSKLIATNPYSRYFLSKISSLRNEEVLSSVILNILSKIYHNLQKDQLFMIFLSLFNDHQAMYMKFDCPREALLTLVKHTKIYLLYLISL